MWGKPLKPYMYIILFFYLIANFMQKTDFKTEYQKLNKAQKEAIDSIY
jgi:hypothetical protein